MTVSSVIDQNDIANSVQSVMLKSGSDEERNDKLKDTLSYSLPESTQSSRARSSLAHQATLNVAAPNQVDRKVIPRQPNESNSRDGTLMNDLSIPSDDTLHSHKKSNQDLGQGQLSMIMSDTQFAKILTQEPEQLSRSTDDVHQDIESQDGHHALTTPSPRPTVDSMQSTDTFFTAVSEDESTNCDQNENNSAADPSDLDYETASTASSKGTVRPSIHSHETLRNSTPPSRSTSLPTTAANKTANIDNQTPAQAIAQLVRGRSVISSPTPEYQLGGHRKPPAMINIPDSYHTIPRIEEYPASPTSIPSEFMMKNSKSLDMGLLMEDSNIERRRRSIRRNRQTSRIRTSPTNDRRNSMASHSAIPTPTNIYVPITPHPSDAREDEEVDLMRDTVLCTKSVTAYNKEPMMYKTSVASRYSRMKENWREYELVLSNKKLQFLTNKPLGSQGKRITHCIPFKENDKDSPVKLSLFSSLDYTIKLEYADAASRNVTMFVIKARTQLLCTEWYMALYRALPDADKKAIMPWTEIFVPDLNVQIRIPFQEEGIQTNEFNVTADSVEKAALHLLKNDEVWAELLNNLDGKNQLHLCWTIHDRIEWMPLHHKVGQSTQSNFVIGPQSIEQTHNLELRAVEHAPDHVTLRNGEIIMEPPAIAGYLLRENNFRGKSFKQNSLSSRRSYVCTQQHLLFFVPAHKIDAIEHSEHSPNSVMGSFSARSLRSFQRSSTSNLNRRVHEPMMYSTTAHITEDSGNDRALRRKVAHNATIIQNASHLINLLEVIDIRPCMPNDEAGSSRYAQITRLISNHSASHSRYTSNASCCFELEMSNGVVAKFQASTVEAMEEWVQSLYQLIQYWKARKQADLATHMAVKQANHKLVPLHDVYHEANEQPYQETMALFMNEVEEVEEARTIANSQIWNMCTVSGCQSIVKCGPLYVKHAVRRTFTQKYMVLTSSESLHYFEYCLRNIMTGEVLPTSTHEHQGAIDLRQAYIYSGRQCVEDKVVYDLERPNRIFADGLVSSDDVKDCTFVLWQSKKHRSLFDSKSSNPRLATRGHLIIFMARSRQEKEEWVWAIQQSIDRSSREAPEDPILASSTHNEHERPYHNTQDTTSLYTI